MYCPECHRDYKPGISACPECSVPLVSQVPVAGAASHQRLKSATLGLILASIYFFLTRTSGTFLPEIFRHLLVARISLVLSLFASLIGVLFFAYFYSDYARTEQKNLRIASLLVTIAAVAMSLVHFRGLLFVFNLPLTFNLIRLPVFAGIETAIPWVYATFFLGFMAAFHSEAKKSPQIVLRKAISIGLVGAVISFAIRTYIIIMFIAQGQIRWLGDLSASSMLLFLPLLTIVFLTGLYFLIMFYRSLQLEEK